MPGLDGLEVAVFENRRASTMAELVRAHGGVPLCAPAVREIPLEPGPDAIDFARFLRAGRIDCVVFLTGGSVTALPQVMAPILGSDELVRLLGAARLCARGPKTAQALEALGLPGTLATREPHTIERLTKDLDRAHPVAGQVVAVIEDGAHHAVLHADLIDRGAQTVLPVAVYRWALPEDVDPLIAAIGELVSGRARVALFTNGAQVDGVMGVAGELDLDEPLRDALRRGVVGAIGATCAQRLRAYGIEPTVVPEHARMADLVEVAAAHVAGSTERRMG